MQVVSRTHKMPQSIHASALRLSAFQGKYRFLLLFLLLPFILASCSWPGGRAVDTSATPTGSSQSTYVAIGASDTFGLGTHDPYTQNWANDLGRLLGARYHVVNLGVPGILVHQALDVELPIALDARPDLVTIWLAVNDIAAHVPVASYEQDLDTLLSRLQASRPHARIVIANVPDLTALRGFYALYASSGKSLSDPNLPASQLQQLTPEIQQQATLYNTAISNVVRQHKILLVDLSQPGYDLPNHPEYISADGLHPTSLGYKRLAELFYQTLNKGKA